MARQTGRGDKAHTRDAGCQGRSLQCVTAVAAALLAGCAMTGPDYRRAPVGGPGGHKEAGPRKGGGPQVIDSAHAWWTLYGDATLDALIGEANQANQSIRQAEAQYRQARA